MTMNMKFSLRNGVILSPRIQKIMNEICETHFKPAIRNLKLNLGEENVSATALDDICMTALETAKERRQ